MGTSIDASELVMFTIYNNPTDYPGYFVVRRWRINGATATPDSMPKALCRSLEDARAYLPPGLHRLVRDPKDDPVIVESWI